MAEHAERARESQAKRGGPPQALSGARNDALQRRAAAREAGYGALLSARPPGPRPIQRRIVSEALAIEGPKEAGAREDRAGSHPVQRVHRYMGIGPDLVGEGGTAHLHCLFDDADITSLHLTVADKRNYGARTWASRRSYTPTSVGGGNWGAFVNNMGHPPPWALNVAGERGKQDAEAAFHANPQIAALLLARWPPQALNLGDQNQFPALGPQPAAANQQPAAAGLNPHAAAFVLNPHAVPFVPANGV